MVAGATKSCRDLRKSPRRFGQGCELHQGSERIFRVYEQKTEIVRTWIYVD